VATYNRNGELAALQDGTGQTSNLGFDDKGRLAYTRDPNGGYRSIQYDELGRVSATGDELGNTTATAYGPLDQVASTTDPQGSRTGYTYYHYDDPDARPAGSGDPEGALIRLTDALGGVTEYHYNDYGQVTNEQRFLPLTTNTVATGYAYSAAGDLLFARDPLWDSSRSNYHQTAYTYDANGLRQTEVRWRTTVLRNPNPALTNQVLTTATYYDGQGRVRTNVVSSRTGSNGSDDPATQTTATVYAANGKPSATVDALGRTTTLTYDARGNLIETLYPDNTVTRTVYDALNRPVWTQERSALTANTNSIAPATQTDYDAVGRVVKVRRWDTVTLTKQRATATSTITSWSTQYRRATGFTNEQSCMLAVTATNAQMLACTRTQYDPAGRVVYTMDANGHVTGYGYDAAGRRTSLTNYTAFTVSPVETNSLVPNPQTGLVTTFSHDANGNQTGATDALGRLTTYEYDALNRRTAVFLPKATNEPQLLRLTAYDALGRRARETDEAGVVTAFGYDALGQLTAVTNDFRLEGTNYVGTGVATNVYRYDEVGNLTNHVDALGRVTAFEFDGFGRRIRRTLPGGQAETLGYDAAGNQLSHTTFNGLTITNAYDTANRLLSCWQGATSLLSFGYSAAGRRLTMTNTAGVNAYSFDALGRLTADSTPVGTVNYSYDANGNLTGLWSATANGVSNTYQYDALNRITNVVDYRLSTSRSNTTYAFDGVGNLQVVTYPGTGTVLTNLCQYDSRNRLTNLTWRAGGSALANFAYTLGLAGNRSSLLETNNGTARAYTWAYDSRYRLTNETISASPAGTLAYAYDAVGNRTGRTGSLGNLGAQTLYHDYDDRVDNDSNPATASTYADAAGNTTTLGGTWQYDWANRLTNYSAGAVALTYDGDGNRIKKVAGGVTTLFLVATVNPTGYPQVVEELTVGSGTTNLAKAYLYGLDLVGQRESGTAYFFGTDGLGSTRFLTATNASVANAFTYEAYGTLVASNATAQTSYLFAGEQWDPDLGMYYLRARYLSPGHGRFWSMDSFEGSNQDPLSRHKYLYCHADPVNGTDPSGHFMEGIGGVLTTTAIQKGLRGMQAPTISVPGRIAARGFMKWAWLTGGIASGAAYLVQDTELGMEVQVGLRSNPTGSRYAYEKERCIEFADDAIKSFRRRGENPKRITFQNNPAKTFYNIAAARGFGLFGVLGSPYDNVSIGGYHEGVLVKGCVFDNNVPFGVPREAWEQGYEIMTRFDFRIITIGEANRTGAGKIEVKE
jgi:RHS repeat-associated protein